MYDNSETARWKLLCLFQSQSLYGWFLSNCSSEVEKALKIVLEDTEDNDVRLFGPRLGIAAHKLGIKLLAPRGEKLHFRGAGLTKHLSITQSELPLTPMQEEAWKDAFETVVGNMRCASAVPFPCKVSLMML